MNDNDHQNAVVNGDPEIEFSGSGARQRLTDSLLKNYAANPEGADDVAFLDTVEASIGSERGELLANPHRKIRTALLWAGGIAALLMVAIGIGFLSTRDAESVSLNAGQTDSGGGSPHAENPKETLPRAIAGPPENQDDKERIDRAQPPSTTGSASGFKSIKAIVNGEAITSAEVDTAVAIRIQLWIFENKNDPTLTQAKVDAHVEEFKKQALDELIDRKLILAEFSKLGGRIKETYVDAAIKDFTHRQFNGDREKFLSELKKTGMTIRQFREIQREKIIVQAMRSQNDGPETLVHSPEELEEVYKEIKDDFASDTRITLRMISIPQQFGADTTSADGQKTLVEDIRRQLLNGQDFATLAKAHSSDSYAPKGGLVGNGEIDESFLSPKLSEVAFSLPVGEVSEVIDDGAFWRLMRVDAKSGGAAPSFDDLKDTSDKLATQRKRKEYVERWLAKLRHKASIEVFD